MRRRISKVLSVVLLTGLVCSGLTGCGGEFSGEEHAVSESAVSGSAVSEAAVVEEDDQGEAAEHTRHRFATDKNFYMLAYDSKVDEFGDEDQMTSGFLCIRKDDVSQKEIVKTDKFRSLLTVMEDNIFFVKRENDSDTDTVWRMPIEKDKDGYDIPKKEEEEMLFEEKEGIICHSGSFVYGSCITYVTYGGEDYEGKAVRYDWKTGKKSVHNLHGNIVKLVQMDREHLIVANMYGGYSCWDVKNDSWTKFSDDEQAVDEPFAASEDFFFYVVQDEKTGDEEIRRYDIRTNQEESFLTSKQLDKECEAFVKEQGGKYDYCSLWNLFCYHDRLYVEVQLDWTKQNQYRMNYVTLCVDTAGENKLRVDEDWMAFIRKNSTDETIKEKVRGCDSAVYNDSGGMYMVNGKVILFLNGKKGVHIGCYDLEEKTGKIVKEEKDAEYFLPYYDRGGADEYDDGVYPEWQMEGGMNFVPSELEDYWGDC